MSILLLHSYVVAVVVCVINSTDVSMYIILHHYKAVCDSVLKSCSTVH